MFNRVLYTNTAEQTIVYAVTYRNYYKESLIKYQKVTNKIDFNLYL